MQTYTHYKDSGIDWIGQIPEHWECKRLGNWFEERRKKVSDKDFAPLSVTKNGIVPQLDSAAKSNDGDNRKLVMSGDFVINSRSDRKGSSGLSYLDGSVSLINIVMKPRGIYPKFSEFLLKSNGFIEEFYRNGHGIVADLWTTRYDEMKFIFLAIPPIQEQEAIANFLDEKTAKIDALVQTKEQQIEKLKELRQAKIHQAVTKGLDAHAPTKDSGVAWIGEIPKHWEVKRLKNIGNAIIGLTYSPNDLCDSNQGTLVLRSSNLQNNGIEYNDNVFVKTKIPKKLKLIIDDIVICSRNGSRELIGKCGIVKNEDLGNTFGAFTTVFRSNINKFLFQILSSGIFKSYSGMFLTSTINQLTISNLNSFEVPIPPIQEQEQIVAYLDEVTGKIDQAIAQKQEQITKLKEYKQSLINDVVTGKVKVF